jgi:3-hydroxyisobutyrate dehydrogenase-like beta-hydroxyacid dehydrogenase
MRVGLLHPGEMGAALAAQIGDNVFWASEGRSDATKARARSAGINDCVSLPALVDTCDMVISVCPPAAARDVALSVSSLGFDGVYVDANALAPATVREIALAFGHFVDGGIVGSPPSAEVECRLYLSGSRSQEVAGLFADSRVVAVSVGVEPGSASAVKAAYAGWTKGSAALLLATAAYARAEGVSDALIAEWQTSIPGLAERLESTASRIGRKAWRFAGEMEEISLAYEEAGMRGEFHEAAADLYERLSRLKDDPGSQSTEEVLGLIVGPGEETPS